MKSQKPKLYKVLKDGKSIHGGHFMWSLPTKGKDGRWKPGKWHSIDGPIRMCHNGFHLTKDPAIWYDRHGCEVYVAEVSGKVIRRGGKIAAAKVRLRRMLSNAELAKLRIFRGGRYTYVGSEHAVFDGASGFIQNRRLTLTVHILGESDVVIHGKCSVGVYDSSRIVIHDSSVARIHDRVECRAHDRATVTAFGEADVGAFQRAHVDGYDRMTASLSDRSSGCFSGNAKVSIYDRARAEIDSGGVQAIAENSSEIIVWRGSPKVELLHYAVEINRTQQEEGKITIRTAEDKG